MPFLKSFCCCRWSLKVGCVIIGAWSLIPIATLSIAACFLSMDELQQFFVREYDKALGDVMIYALPVVLAIFASSAISLIFGALKHRRSYLIPWLVCRVVGVVGSVAHCAIVGIAPSSIFLMVDITLTLYFWLVVSSLYRQPKNGSRQSKLQRDIEMQSAGYIERASDG